MSIKEAIEAGPMDRQRRIINERYSDEGYAELVKADGINLIRRSQAGNVLKSLGELIKSEGGEPLMTSPEHSALDTASISLLWNRRNDNESESDVCSSIRIEARPHTNELVIWGGQEAEILSEAQWFIEEILEDAIVRAYNSPATVLVKVPDQFEDKEVIEVLDIQDESTN